MESNDQATIGNPQPLKPVAEMSRGAMTAWIVGTLIVIALGMLWYATRLPDSSPYKKCQGVIFTDPACKADVAADILLAS